MALSAGLTTAGHPPVSLDTTAAVTLAKVGDAFAITRIDLTTRGVVPGLAESEFQRLAEDAKKNCIISRAISAVPMTVDATLLVTA
jgi:osmotically inducible protein OsmC